MLASGSPSRWPCRSCRSETSRLAPRSSTLLFALALLVGDVARAGARPRSSRSAPLLAPIAGCGLLPLAAWRCRSPARRAVQAAAAVLVAGSRCGDPRRAAALRRRLGRRTSGLRRAATRSAFRQPSGGRCSRGPISRWRRSSWPPWRSCFPSRGRGGSGRSPGSGQGSWRLPCSLPRQPLRRRWSVAVWATCLAVAVR